MRRLVVSLVQGIGVALVCVVIWTLWIGNYGPRFKSGDKVIVHAVVGGKWYAAKTVKETDDVNKWATDKDVEMIFNAGGRVAWGHGPLEATVGVVSGKYIQIDVQRMTHPDMGLNPFVGYVDSSRVTITPATSELVAELKTVIEASERERLAEWQAHMRKLFAGRI